jgi:quinol monooxygenase YgiN
MSKVAAIAKLTAQPGKRDDLVNAMKKLLDNAETESGTEQYILHTDNKDENILWMYEKYVDQSAVDAHMGGEVFKAAGPDLAPFLGGRPEIFFLTPVGGKGI